MCITIIYIFTPSTAYFIVQMPKYCSFMTDKLPQPKCEGRCHKSENYWISSLTTVEIHKLLKALLELLCSFSTWQIIFPKVWKTLKDCTNAAVCICRLG